MKTLVKLVTLFLALAILFLVGLQSLITVAGAFEKQVVEAPDFFSEVGALGENETHPLIEDMVSRMKERFMYSPTLVDVIQYENYVFYDVFAEDGNYWLYVYRWDGEKWTFVEEVCQTCEPEGKKG